MSAQQVQVSDRAVAALQPGAIVLMHIGSHPGDGTTLDADALPIMITRMRAAGYDFVTLDELPAH
jgi:peptidoglycan/xylan/chitin deacetylase (PgdA/CDA1 family)